MEEPFRLTLPLRTKKPRENGISNLVDKGYGMQSLKDVLDLAADYVDIVKLGWGSAYITPCLKEKVRLFSSYDVQTCLGGMMFEISYWQNKVGEYADFLERHGIGIVEVSNGSLPIPDRDKLRMIEFFCRKGLKILAEVGSKDVDVNSPPEEWIRCIRDDLSAGAWKVILEGRADASAGIYDSRGELRDQITETILDSGIPAERLIFETPHKKQVIWFVKRIGPNVNIGNMPLEEVLNFETLRLGLRGDTVTHFQVPSEKQTGVSQ